MAMFSSDPGTDVLLRGLDAGQRARKMREEVSADTAIRRALSTQETPPPAPVLAPGAAPPAQGTIAAQPAPAAPSAAPAAPQAPAAPSSTLAPSAAAPAQASPTLSPYAGVVRELAATPGGGQQALQIMQAQDRGQQGDTRRRDQMARLAVTELARGNQRSAEWYAREAGIPMSQLPPPGAPPAGRGGAGGGAGGAAGAPRQYAIDARIRALQEAGLSREEAASIASGNQMSATSKAHLIRAIQADVDKSPNFSFEDVATRNAEVERRWAFLEGMLRPAAASRDGASPAAASTARDKDMIPGPRPKQIPARAVELLKAHPERAGDFDALFGRGEAAKVLRK